MEKTIFIRKHISISIDHAEKIRKEAFTLSDTEIRISESEIVRRALDMYFEKSAEKS